MTSIPIARLLAAQIVALAHLLTPSAEASDFASTRPLARVE